MPHFALTLSNFVCLAIGAALALGASWMGRVFHTLGQARQAHVLGQVTPGVGEASGLLPGEIMAAIQQSPVVQQPRAAKTYRGMRVRWQVTFESAFASGPFTLRLMCQDRGTYPWVVFDVRRGKYPQLEGMLKHTPFWVSGQVTEIQGDQILLRHVQLSFEN